MKIGLHLQSNVYDKTWRDPSAQRELQLATLKRMGVTDVKLVTDSNSQLLAAKFLVEQGLNVMVRFYKPPVALQAVPDDQLEQFAAVGVTAVEGYVNEPEREWGTIASWSAIDNLAHAHIRHADACARCGLKPITPSMQTDETILAQWFGPFVRRVIDLGRRDALEGSIIGLHPRPVNNLPDALPGGFCVRSYELYDSLIMHEFGHSIPIYATEWGYEPGDSANTTLPPITYTSHAEYNRQLAQTAWRPILRACFYWTWANDWAGSGWWRGDVAMSLPVVKTFIDMQKPVAPPPPPVEPEPPAVVDLSGVIADLENAETRLHAAIVQLKGMGGVP